MKNLFILLILMAGLFSCSVSPPPADIVLGQTAVVSPGNQVLLAEFILDAVGENHEAVSINNLEGTENLYASLATQDPVVVEEAPAENVYLKILDFSLDNWMPLILALSAFLKVVVNLTPTTKDNEIFAWFDKLINAFIPNLKKGGGTHTPST